MLKQKKKGTRSATTNFGKEEVLKIRQGIQVFARNTRSSYIVVFPLGQGRGSQELNQNRNCHIYIYIYMYIYGNVPLIRDKENMIKGIIRVFRANT